MQRIGLYYPYIHFRDEQWLKLTVLYRPQLARVGPEGFPVADSETVRALNDGLGFVEDVRPEAAAQAVAPLFLQLVREHGDEPGQWYNAVLAARGAHFHVTTEPRADAGDAPPGEEAHGPPWRQGVAGLHWDEVAPEVRDGMIDSGLAPRPHSDAAHRLAVLFRPGATGVDRRRYGHRANANFSSWRWRTSPSPTGPRRPLVTSIWFSGAEGTACG